MRIRTLLTTAAALALGASSLFAAQTVPLTPDWIIESRSGGLHYSDFAAPNGWSASSGNVNAPGCTLNIGSMYSGCSLYFGPSRYAQFSFTPTVSGSYQIDLAWPSTAGEHETAVTLYTGDATGGAADYWGNASGPQGVVYFDRMDMSYINVGVWNTFTTAELAAGTTYHVGIYGGYAVNTAAENRVVAGAAGFSMIPEPSTALLGILGGLGIMAWINRRRAS